jgi:hypothetical protein
VGSSFGPARRGLGRRARWIREARPQAGVDLLELVWLVAAVVLMLKVAGGERYRVKGASEYGDRAAHETK